MDAVLLQRLAQITEEERELLQGRGVDRALYASGRAFEVDAAKMLEKGKPVSYTHLDVYKRQALMRWDCTVAARRRRWAATGRLPQLWILTGTGATVLFLSLIHI